MGRKLAGRWPIGSRVALLAGVLAVIAGFVDHAVTSSDLPELTGRILVDDPNFAERNRIQEAFSDRVWIYGVAFLIAVAVAVVIAVRAAEPSDRRELFSDLGVAGVIVAAIGWYTASREPVLFGDSSGEGVFAVVPVTILLCAAAGALVTRTGLAVEARRDPGAASVEPIGGTRGEAFSRFSFGLAGLTVLLVVLGSVGRECGDASSGSNLALWLAFFVSLASAAAGLAALVARRWVAALVAMPMPILAVVGILAAACLE